MDSDHNHGGSGISAWLILLGLLGSATAYFWSQGDLLAATTLVAITIAGFSGYRVGALKLVGFIGGVAVAIAYAPILGRTLEPQFAEWLGTTGLSNRMLSIGLVGIGITLVATIVFALISRSLFTERPRLDACNRWLGFGIGAVQGVAVMLIIVGGLLVLEPTVKKRVAARDSVPNKFSLTVAERVLDVTEQTRSSAFGEAVVANNPFEKVPQLAKVQKSVRVVSDPDRLNQLIHQPSRDKHEFSPAISSAIDKLSADPEIQQVLESGKPVTHQTIMSLMNNPAILELLDDPNFLSEITKLIGEFHPELGDSLGSLK